MIRFERDQSREQILSDLRAAAEERWGTERREAPQSGLEAAAEALWQLAQAAPAPLEAEPDFVGGLERSDDV